MRPITRKHYFLVCHCEERSDVAISIKVYAQIIDGIATTAVQCKIPHTGWVWGFGQMRYSRLPFSVVMRWTSSTLRPRISASFSAIR